jgi:16S rRNA (guanine966-N2)-methyltransferase
MRIVAGTVRGRTLRAPKSREIRPTADRVRESIFNILGQWTDGLAVLDLFAGTGALALEALSRGAVSALLVDSGREAQALCRENIRTLGFESQTELWALPAARAVERLSKSSRKFDLIFADPPYAQKVGETLLGQIAQGGLLTPEGRLVFEHGKEEPSLSEVLGLSRYDLRLFGDTQVSFYRPSASTFAGE